MVMRRELSGEGGAYQHQLDAALGRFARLNANLSFEYETLADTPNWSGVGPSSPFSFSLTDRPRRIRAESDGTGNTFGGVVSDGLITFESLGPFRVTFNNVSVTGNSTGFVQIGLTDAAVDSNTTSSSNGITLGLLSGIFRAIDSGSNNLDNTGSIDFSVTRDVSIEYDGQRASVLLDGDAISVLNHTANADYRPFLQLNDSGDVLTSVETDQITVEQIGGTL
jgi:hypothetical protein